MQVKVGQVWRDDFDPNINRVVTGVNSEEVYYALYYSGWFHMSVSCCGNEFIYEQILLNDDEAELWKLLYMRDRHET